MGSFGESVRALLDTYKRCLKLLKGLRQGGQPSDAQSSLGSLIRADRAKVRRVYSSGLARRGATFEKGDASARSSMRRVVRRLTSTLAGVMRTFTRQSVDYDSLESLVNSSRRDAIRTMTDLSSRVGSNGSLRSRGSSRSTSGSSRTSRSHNHNHNRKRQKKKDSEKPRRRSNDGIQSPQRGNKRVSMATMSSGSTKLGEIQRRNSKLASHRVTYPLHMRAQSPTGEDGDGNDRRKWFSFWRGR